MGPSLSLLLRVLRLISCLSLRRSKPPCCCSPFLRFLVLLLVLAVFQILISGIWRIPIPNGKQPSLMRIRSSKGGGLLSNNRFELLGADDVEFPALPSKSVLHPPHTKPDCLPTHGNTCFVAAAVRCLAHMVKHSSVASADVHDPSLRQLLSDCALLRGRVSSLHCTLQDLLAQHFWTSNSELELSCELCFSEHKTPQSKVVQHKDWLLLQVLRAGADDSKRLPS